MSTAANIVVLLSGRGSNLQSLLNAENSGKLGGSVGLVVSNRPGVGGIAVAREAGIDVALIDHQTYPSREAFDRDLVKAIKSVSPDLIVLAGFMRILTNEFVAAFADRIMNIHPSLLPRYPGLQTHQRALDNGDSHAGATVHYVNGELDGGPLVLQARVKIAPNDTAYSLATRVLKFEHEIYPTAVNWHLTGSLSYRDGTLYRQGIPIPPSGHLWEGSE